VKRDGRDRDMQVFGDIAVGKSARKPFQALRFALAQRTTHLRSNAGHAENANNPTTEIFLQAPAADGTQA